MNPLVVVVSDVVRYFFASCFEIVVGIHFKLSLDGSKAALHEGVVVAVIGATHALFDLPLLEQSTIVLACVLAATIGVVH